MLIKYLKDFIITIPSVEIVEDENERNDNCKFKIKLPRYENLYDIINKYYLLAYLLNFNEVRNDINSKFDLKLTKNNDVNLLASLFTIDVKYNHNNDLDYLSGFTINLIKDDIVYQESFDLKYKIQNESYHPVDGDIIKNFDLHLGKTFGKDITYR